MPTEHYEDISLHQTHRLGPFVLTEKDILDFAGQWDPLPLHVDPEFAKTTDKGHVIASGFQLLAVCQKLMVERKPMAIVVGLGLDEVRFMTSGMPGDHLFLEIEAIAKRESKSRPHAGIVTHSFRLLNQHGDAILTYKGTGIIKKRHAASGAGAIRP
jgi:acyl dehydratase